MSTATIRRRDRKRKKNKKRSLKRHSHEQWKKAFRCFPVVVCQHEGATERLADAVRTAVKDFIIRHEALLYADDTLLLHRFKRIGIRRTASQVRTHAIKTFGRKDAASIVSCWLSSPIVSMGDHILSQLPSPVVQAYFPFSRFRIVLGRPRDNMILIEMQSLCTAKTQYGTAYFSPHKPVLEIGGGQWIVAFSDHAVRRICQRTVGSWESYLDLGYAFSVMYDTVYFEPWRTSHEEKGFVVYKEYAHPDPKDSLIRSIVGHHDSTKRYFYRVGYCPAVVDNGFLRAKTLLLPGMTGTPEYARCLRRSITSHEKRAELQQQVGNLAFSELTKPSHLNLVKQFHDSGIPQIVSFDHEVTRMKV